MHNLQGITVSYLQSFQRHLACGLRRIMRLQQQQQQGRKRLAQLRTLNSLDLCWKGRNRWCSVCLRCTTIIARLNGLLFVDILYLNELGGARGMVAVFPSGSPGCLSIGHPAATSSHPLLPLNGVCLLNSHSGMAMM